MYMGTLYGFPFGSLVIWYPNHLCISLPSAVGYTGVVRTNGMWELTHVRYTYTVLGLTLVGLGSGPVVSLIWYLTGC